jgi:hypothetical protein
MGARGSRKKRAVKAYREFPSIEVVRHPEIVEARKPHLAAQLSAHAAKAGRVVVGVTYRFHATPFVNRDFAVLVAHASTEPRPGWRKPRRATP